MSKIDGWRPSPADPPDKRSNEAMDTRTSPSCDDCYFKRAGLCALTLGAPCPTFRLATRGRLVPPPQPRLVPPPIVLTQHAAA